MAIIDENFTGTALYGNELILEGKRFTKDSLNDLTRQVVSQRGTSITIPDYTINAIYNVYRDGLFLVPDVDYTIDSSGVVTPTSSIFGYYSVVIYKPGSQLENTNLSDAISVGTEAIKDGITSICIYDAGSEQSWGRYIFVDKNHDLSYYISGSDYKDEADKTNEDNPCINLESKYGYEWGGYQTTTGITSQEIGSGLSNTNSLIGLNLSPHTEGWRVVWDMVSQFRSSHSDKWFVPTVNELKEVYNQRSYLNNLSTSTNYCYWVSSEFNSSNAWFFYFNNGSRTITYKDVHSRRARLCWYL